MTLTPTYQHQQIACSLVQHVSIGGSYKKAFS